MLTDFYLSSSYAAPIGAGISTSDLQGWRQTTQAYGQEVKHGGNLEKKSRWILNTHYLEIIPKPVFGGQVDAAYLLKTWYWEELFQLAEEFPHQDLQQCIIMGSILQWEDLLWQEKYISPNKLILLQTNTQGRFKKKKKKKCWRKTHPEIFFLSDSSVSNVWTSFIKADFKTPPLPLDPIMKSPGEVSLKA